MRIDTYCFFFIAIFVFFGSNAFAQTDHNIQQIAQIKDPFVQLESVLEISAQLVKDSSTMKKQLAPLLQLAEQKKSTTLKWAYYILLADGYSITFDRTNPRSDDCYQQASKLVKSDTSIELQLIGEVRQGYYNFIYRNVIGAFPYFLRANDLHAKCSPQKIPLILKHYQFVAGFFSHIGDQKKAVSYLTETLAFAKSATRERIDLINSIAVFLSSDNQKKQAKHYFELAMKEAEQAKDSVWIGIISGNLADYIWEEGDKGKAIELVKRNIDLSLRYNETQDAMRANLVLAHWYVDMHAWKLAQQHVLASQQLMETKPYYLTYQMDAAHLLAKISNGLGERPEALYHLQHYVQLRDSLEKRNDRKEMQQIIWKSEQEKYKRTVQLAAAQRKETNRMYQYTGLCLILSFAVIVLLINRSKGRIKIKHAYLEKEQLTLTYEKQLLDQELLILKDSLGEFTDTIKRNNATIQNLRQELAHSEHQTPQYIHEITENLDQLLQSHIMTDERWIKFRYVFNTVYPGYLQEMKETYPKISENDLKILALQKLGLNNGTMSELLCISIEGIKKAKQRLKKKLIRPVVSLRDE